MKYLTFIFSIIFFSTCGQNNNSLEKEITNLSMDTLQANHYLLTFTYSAPFSPTDIYGDLAYRKQLTDTAINNYFVRANIIQSYLSNHLSNYFYITDSTLVLKLIDGEIVCFNRWDSEKEVGYIFEHYFETIDYYLLIEHYFEESNWLFVNRKNGFQKSIKGLPYISIDNKRIITINSDLDAGYNFNGIELYTILPDSIQTEFSIETIWGPLDVQWISDNQFLVKREHFSVDSTIIDYKRVLIEKIKKDL